MTLSYGSKVLKGSLPVPHDRIETWSAALGLQGSAAAEFRQLALLALSPVEVRELVEELQQELRKRTGRRER
jgi:hypothetical protein